MAKSNGLKMARQLQIYDLVAGVRNGAVYSPTEIMAAFGITRRMLQRDLKDIRDSGLINVVYDKAEYYSLFPDSNERTRQRDFEEMNRAGFEIYYSRKNKSFIFEYDYGI